MSATTRVQVQKAASAGAVRAETRVARRHWLPRDLFAGLLLLGGLIWSYWETLVGLWREWENPNYSAGMLVPFAAAYILYQERESLARLKPRAAWAGLVLVAIAFALRYLALVDLRESIDRASLIVMIAGLTLFLCGWTIFWRLRWLILFLFLALPLPGTIHNAIADPLQTWSTGATVFVLQTVGLDVDREGHVLTLNGSQPVGIEEACSGLRMLTAFVIVAAMLAFLIERPAWQRTILVLSSVGVAMLCNLIRLCLTAVLFLYLPGGFAKQFAHDMAGMALMMPLAVGFLLLELWVLQRLTKPDPRKTVAG